MQSRSASVDKRAKTCCFTGHRKIPAEDYRTIEKRLEKTVLKLIQEGIIYYGAGGALGFDTMAAQTVIRLKKKFPEVKLILVLPCESQTERWSDKDKEIYNDVLKNADKVVYTAKQYYKGCMQVRNRHLVNFSSVCVSYLTEQSGGTAYTVEYARQMGLRIINVAHKF